MNALILSGPTHEYIDPVRFIGNASSGRMGKALAIAAIREGYQVEFITGPVSPENLPEMGDSGRIRKVISAADMLASARARFDSADLVIFAAAIADYTPVETLSEKMAKSADGLTLKLQATADVAKTLCADKRSNQIAIGFALQTSNGEANARRKLETKNLDGIVLNTPATLSSGLGDFSFLSASAQAFERWGVIEKSECANRLFAAIATLNRER